MSYWEWEAPAWPLPCRTTHLCPSSTFSEEQCVTDLSSLPLPQVSFSPGLLLLRAIEDREHLTLENILYCREFKKDGTQLVFFPLSVSKDLIYKTALETTSHQVYFLCQPGPSVKCCCLWPAQWSISALELKYVRVMSRKVWGVGILSFVPRKMIFMQFYRNGIEMGYGKAMLQVSQI